MSESLKRTMPSAAPSRQRVSDDVAYIAPMAGFLVLTQASIWWPGAAAELYIAKALLAAALLAVFWRRYEPIRWNGWRLGLLIGIIGIVQWVGMEKLLLWAWSAYPRIHVPVLDPMGAFASRPAAFAFVAFRLASAVLLVPVMEELFWRDYLWRTIIAPADFRLARVGEYHLWALIVVSALCASVHVQWITALVWSLMIGLLLLRTRSLGACIIAHAVTNLLLGIYVLCSGDWYFW